MNMRWVSLEGFVWDFFVCVFGIVAELLLILKCVLANFAGRLELLDSYGKGVYYMNVIGIQSCGSSYLNPLKIFSYCI